MSILYKTKVILAKWILQFLYRPGRYRVTGEELIEEYRRREQSVIIAMWHGQLLTAFMRHANRGNTALAGTHRDASLIVDIGKRLNWHFVRGSSSEDSIMAFKSMVRELKKPGTVFLITPDGPRGPAGIVKPGVIKASQLTGAPIIPAAGQATRRWEFRNWDVFYTAKPCSRIELCFGDPVVIAPDDDTKKAAGELEAELNRLTRLVEKKCDA